MKRHSSEVLTPEKLKEYKIVEGWAHLTTESVKPFIDDYQEIRFEKIIFKQIVLVEGDFKNKMNFSECFFDGGAFFHKGSNFSEEVWIQECYFHDFLKFCDEVNFQKSVYISNLVCKNFYLHRAKFQNVMLNFRDVDEIYFDHADFEDMRLSWREKTIIQRLKLNASALNGELTVFGGDKGGIFDIMVMGGSKNLKLNFESLFVHRFYFFLYTAGTGLRLSKINAINSDYPSEFLIGGSNLGKAEFYDIALSAFQMVNIFDTYLLETIFVGIKWPNFFHYYEYGFLSADKSPYQHKYQTICEGFRNKVKGTNLIELPQVNPDYKDRESLEKIKETMRQIKLCYSKQGDFQLEHQFHILEMILLNKLLTFRKDGFQKFVIGFSYHFSEFGQSITRPLIGLLGGHLILFMLLVAFGNLPLSTHLTFNFQAFNHTVYYYLILINPVRTFNFAGQGISIIIDLTMRIWSSAMIFNLIRATRRFIK